MPHVARATILVPRQRPDNYQVPTLQPHMSDGLTKTSDDLDRNYQKIIQPSETP